MRKTLRAAALALALCAPAYAGDIPNPPAPPKGITAEEVPAYSGSETQAVDSIAEAALSLLESVLALF